MKIILISFLRMLIVLLVLLFDATIYSQTLPQNISSSAGWDGEPVLAVNPANPSNLVIAWMSFQLPVRIGIECRASLDGGQSWSSSFFQPHFSTSFSSADPCLAFSRNGNLFLAYIDYRTNPDSGGIYVTRSTNGGISWDLPVKALDALISPERPIDRPWLVIDNSGTGSDGSLYLSTKPAPWIPAPNRPTYSVSTDQGLSWSPLRFADTSGFTSSVIQSPMISPAVGADGVLYMAYPAMNGILPSFALGTSNDQGSSLQHSWILPAQLSGDTNPKQAWHLQADPLLAGHLLLVWPDNRNGDLDVYASTTLDGGLSWSQPVRVNDDASGNGIMQDMVWSGISDQGVQVIAWRDRRNAGTGFFQGFDIYAAYSTNRGISYSPNIRISPATAPFDSSLSNAGNDFLGLDIRGDTAHIAWADHSSGNLDVFHSALDLSLFSEIKSPENTVSIFTNRGSGLYTLRSSAEKLIYLFTSDSRGIALRNIPVRIESNEMTLDLSTVPGGIYLVHIELNGQKRVLKLSKP